MLLLTLRLNCLHQQVVAHHSSGLRRSRCSWALRSTHEHQGDRRERLSDVPFSDDYSVGAPSLIAAMVQSVKTGDGVTMVLVIQYMS